jgi:hypothetical protein
VTARRAVGLILWVLFGVYLKISGFGIAGAWPLATPFFLLGLFTGRWWAPLLLVGVWLVIAALAGVMFGFGQEPDEGWAAAAIITLEGAVVAALIGLLGALIGGRRGRATPSSWRLRLSRWCSARRERRWSPGSGGT